MQLEKGQFSPCTVKWNPLKNIIEKNTLEEIHDCCNDKCKDSHAKCLEYCNKNNTCKKTCNYIEEICTDNCIIPLHTNEYDDIMKCIHSLNCKQNDIKCFETNKENMLKCCESKCVYTNSNSNCIDYCNSLYNHLLDEAHENAVKKFHVKTKSSIIFYNTSIILSLILLVFFLLVVSIL